MAGRGFSYPVLFGDEKSDIRATVERRLRYVSTFMNSYIATYDTDTRDLRIRDGGGVMAGTGFVETDDLHLTTKAYVDNAVAGSGGGGGTVLAGNTSVTSGVTATATETEFGVVTISGLGAAATVYADVTVSLRVPTPAANTYVSVRPGINGVAQGTYPAIQDSSSSSGTGSHTHSVSVGGSTSTDGPNVAGHQHSLVVPSGYTDWHNQESTAHSHTTSSSGSTGSGGGGVSNVAPTYLFVSQRKVVQTAADGSGDLKLGAFCRVGAGSYGSCIVEVAYMVYSR